MFRHAVSYDNHSKRAERINLGAAGTASLPGQMLTERILLRRNVKFLYLMRLRQYESGTMCRMALAYTPELQIPIYYLSDAHIN